MFFYFFCRLSLPPFANYVYCSLFLLQAGKNAVKEKQTTANWDGDLNYTELINVQAAFHSPLNRSHFCLHISCKRESNRRGGKGEGVEEVYLLLSLAHKLLERGPQLNQRLNLGVLARHAAGRQLGKKGIFFNGTISMILYDVPIRYATANLVPVPTTVQ